MVAAHISFLEPVSLRRSVIDSDVAARLSVLQKNDVSTVKLKLRGVRLVCLAVRNQLQLLKVLANVSLKPVEQILGVSAALRGLRPELRCDTLIVLSRDFHI